MKKLMLLLLVGSMSPQQTNAQKASYVALDVIKVKDGLWKEALFFFKNNWEVYRQDAIKQGIISSYQLLINRADSVSNNIILITQYPDSLAYVKSEESFRPILKKLRPDGPIYLNDKRRNDFIQTLAFNGYKVWIDNKEKQK